MKRTLAILLLTLLGLGAAATGAVAKPADVKFEAADFSMSFAAPILAALKKEFNQDPGRFDYLRKGTAEFIVRLENGLYYATLDGKTAELQRLTGDHLSSVDLAGSFEGKDGKVFVLNYRDMKRGILTDWYALLEFHADRPFETEDFQVIQGFERDDEGSGDTGIAADVTVDGVRWFAGKGKNPDRLEFKVSVTDLKTKRVKRERRIFVKRGRDYVER